MYFSPEWLEQKLATLHTDEEKRWQKITFLSGAADLFPEYSLRLCAELEQDAERNNIAALKAYVLVFKAQSELPTHRPEAFRKKMDEAERIARACEPSMFTAMVLQMRAFAYWAEGQRDRALAISYAARSQMIEQAGEAWGWTDYQLAVFHTDLKEYDKALEYFDYSEKVALAENGVYQLARIQSGRAAIAIAQNRIDDAVLLNELALKGYSDCGHHTAKSRALNDLGVICFRQGNHEKGKQYLTEAMEIRRKSKYWPGLTTTLIELARIFIAEKDYDRAKELLQESLKMSMEIDALQKAITCHSLLSEIHKNVGDYKSAFVHLEEGHSIQSKLTGEEASNKIKALQQKHATEQAEKLAELERKKNIELKKAYDAIEEQNTSILDSINYAQRIQTALLGSRALVNKYLPENFILYKPKDIVSGDFWWCAEKNDRFYFAVADCTGHGVPGAFMSLLNINFLNRALNINQDAHPATLLNNVRAHVIASLNHDGIETARDGMDVVLCAIDVKTGILDFACANNTLILVRDGMQTVYVPDKFPVGLGHCEELAPFTPNSIQLKSGDCIYLSTDGFPDQFGGEKGKKFKQKRLRELLAKNAALPMNEQESELATIFENWRGKLEQVDDVLVLGFRMIVHS